MKDICEQNNACDVDQHSFKAYLSRWMTACTQMAPFTADIINPLLLSSAKAATAQCVGAPTGNVCGLKWYNNGTWDGTAGVGQQMAALEVVLGTLVGQSTSAVTNSTGGTSPSNPTAGYNASSIPPGQVVTPPSKADKVGAWFLTALFSVAALYMWWFMNSSGFEWRNGVGTRPTVGGKPGRKGRTVSTYDMDGVASTKEVSPANGVREKDILPVHAQPLDARRASANGNARNVLTKPDRSSTFSSTGIFPSDRNATHARSASFVSNKARDSGRGLPVIAERERGERRRRRSSLGVSGGGGEGKGSKFREEEMPSRLD